MRGKTVFVLAFIGQLLGMATAAIVIGVPPGSSAQWEAGMALVVLLALGLLVRWDKGFYDV